VVELIGDDEIFFAQNRRDRAGIGGESRLKNHASFHILEAGNFLFQLHVDLHGAGNGAHRSRTYAVFARGLERCFAQLGMRGQAKIIIGRKIDDLLAIKGAHRFLLVFQHAQLEVGPFVFEFVELVGEIRELRAGCADCHKFNLIVLSTHPFKSSLENSMMVVGSLKLLYRAQIGRTRK